MLVLTRRPGESIIIQVPGGPVITVEVCRIQGQRVQLGTTAPKDYLIFRPENEKLPAIATAGAEGCMMRDTTRHQLTQGDSPQTGDRDETS